MVHYLAKKEYFDGKFAWFFKLAGCIPVNRKIKDTKASTHAIELLKSGHAVGLFPEGTRNKTEEPLLKFKHGAAKIAKEANSKIVPFAIKGEYKVFRKKLIIEFGKPIDVSDMEVEVATDYIRNEVLNLLRK